jgi:hypothetical protein
MHSCRKMGSRQEICKPFFHGKLESWIPGNDFSWKVFFFLVSKKNDIILEKLYPASTAVRRFSEHCISWDGPQNHGKNEKLTHIEMGIWWDKSINH